jgi:hypothetical protein
VHAKAVGRPPGGSSLAQSLGGYRRTMGASGGPRAGLVPVHVGHDMPPAAGPPAAEGADDASLRGPGRWRPRHSALEDPSIDWQRHGVEPRWLGMETSDCVAALEPGIFHDHGATELERFLTGAKSRNETALIIATIGDVEDDAPRFPLATADASVLLPGLEGSISGVRLPAGARPSLATDMGAADRDFGLRLLNRPADAPWWSLRLSGTTSYPGAGGPPTQHEPAGQLEPILVDGLGHPVVAAWSPTSGDQRWYVIPDATDWNGILAWLVHQALPTRVPDALRRARSPHALDPALQTPTEAAARRALDDLDTSHAQERRRLESELQQASAVADPVRYGLLYGTGAELVKAVASVLEAAGFATVDLDELLGDTTSADLLVTYEQERRLVEVKSASGNAPEALVGHLDRHLETWPQMRPGEPVGGGVLVVNHQHRLEPSERTPAVYARREFVAALTVPVLATPQLFDWWRDSDWPAIRQAVLGRSSRPDEQAPREPLTPPSTPPPGASLEPAGRLPRWRRKWARRRRVD